MTSIARLKDKARKYEQKEDWRAAIQVYRQVLEKQEASDDLDLDLGLFNRIGDLNLRIGETDEAVRFYERAADAYAEFGFTNNAIALCNKAIRHRPDRSELYLKLSRLYSRQGFQTDARRWILEYAERQVAAGRAKEALEGLEEFADLSADPEIRELLAQQLAAHGRKDEAIKQLQTAYAMRLEAGQDDKAAELAARARAIDSSVDLGGTASAVPGLMVEDPSATEADDDSDLEDQLVTTGRVQTPDELEAEGEAVEGLQTGYTDHDDDGSETETVGELETFGPDDEPNERETGTPKPLPLLDDEEEEDETEEVEPLPTLESGYEKLAGRETVAEAEPAGAPDRAVRSGEAEDAVRPEEAEDAVASADEPVAGEVEAASEEAAGDGVDEVAADVVEEAAPEAVEEEAPEVVEEEVPEAVEEVAGEAEVAEEPVGPAGAEDKPPMHLSFEEGDAEAHGGVMGGPEEKDADVEVPDFAMDVDMDSLAEGLGAEVGTAETLDVDAILNRSRELVSRGLTGEALYELHLLSGSDAAPETFEDALTVVHEILRRDENDITALERRVEYAARIGDDEFLVDAYLDLADALTRGGQETKAQIMYARALHLDPANEAAREALGEAADDGGVDVKAIMEELETDETAAALADGVHQSDPEFAAMLDQFRAKVTDNVAPEEAGDHYDLGIAFKEMGLIDEAIAEFQVALTGGEERLKVYEELGQCFVLKGRHNVAVRVFERALKVPATEPAERLGVYYHLGQCYEELGQRDAARAAYREVLSIDESFEDVPDRMARL